MSEKINGGPAFARPGFTATEYESQEGMLLRDYFAAAAVQGMMARADVAVSVGLENVPNTAYMIADIMIKERNKSQ